MRDLEHDLSVSELHRCLVLLFELRRGLVLKVHVDARPIRRDARYEAAVTDNGGGHEVSVSPRVLLLPGKPPKRAQERENRMRAAPEIFVLKLYFETRKIILTEPYEYDIRLCQSSETGYPEQTDTVLKSRAIKNGSG